MKTIKVSEMFYSIQGEGVSVGKPAVFLRLTGCRLNCSWCDTVAVWRKGVEYTYAGLQKKMEELDLIDPLTKGARLVLTGGDPLMQQGAVTEFFANYLPKGTFIEVETEGVIQPESTFDFHIQQYNVSPKLRNSGMRYSHRIKYQVLRWHADDSNRSFFKFAVRNETDVLEAVELCDHFDIPHFRLWLMPVCDTRASHDEAGPVIAELAKKYCLNYSPRLHLQLWDRATGV